MLKREQNIMKLLLGNWFAFLNKFELKWIKQDPFEM